MFLQWGPPGPRKFLGRVTLFIFMLALVGASLVAVPLAARAYADTAHPPIYLRTESGQIINPLAGQNADQPYSPEKTCGLSGCHDYNQITQGYHFQQGHDVISDHYSTTNPESLSPGMQGKY